MIRMLKALMFTPKAEPVLCCPRCRTRFSEWFVNSRCKMYCFPCAGVSEADSTELNEDNGVWL